MKLIFTIYSAQPKKPVASNELKDEIKTEESVEVRSLKAQTPFSEDKKKLLHTERVNHVRNVNHIIVHGPQPEDPVETFDEMVSQCAVPQLIANNLIATGYDKPTPIQMQAIPIMAAVSFSHISREDIFV